MSIFPEDLRSGEPRSCCISAYIRSRLFGFRICFSRLRPPFHHTPKPYHRDVHRLISTRLMHCVKYSRSIRFLPIRGRSIISKMSSTIPQRQDSDSDAVDNMAAVYPLVMIPLRQTKSIHFIRHGQGFHNVAGHANHENYKSEEWYTYFLIQPSIAVPMLTSYA